VRVYTLILACFLSAPAGAAVGSSNSVGMNIHVGHEGFLDAARDLGVEWVRMDANWFWLEPADDAFFWTTLDTWVTRANEEPALNVYLTLAYTPEWVGRHGDSDGAFHNDVPNDDSEWVEFVEAAVTHYRALGVTHYGMWNEANLDHFFEGSVEEYVDIILVPGAAAVRNACDDCLVLGPDLAHVGDADDYLEAVLARAPAGTLDIIAHHTYNDFSETGWSIWDGDGFINVLDQQRVPGVTRRSLRQILDAAGWDGEVWITETGYRAAPPGDSGEESTQAIYVRRVLEEQLARSWYTNTFFYEIHDCGPDQPECTIDGFGLMRAVSGSPGSRDFPNDYRLKPAFDTVRQFIDDNPQIVGLPVEVDGGVDGNDLADGAGPASDGGPGPDGGPGSDGGPAEDGEIRGDPGLDEGDPGPTPASGDSLGIEGGCACAGGRALWWLIAVSLIFRRR
jgi:hypothetical protein